jgi:hypothetical protein
VTAGEIKRACDPPHPYLPFVSDLLERLPGVVTVGDNQRCVVEVAMVKGAGKGEAPGHGRWRWRSAREVGIKEIVGEKSRER